MTGQEFTKNELIAALACTCVGLWLEKKHLERRNRKLVDNVETLLEVGSVHIQSTNWLIQELNEGRDYKELVQEWNERVTFIEQVNRIRKEEL